MSADGDQKKIHKSLKKKIFKPWCLAVSALATFLKSQFYSHFRYGVATLCRLLKNISLFCKI